MSDYIRHGRGNVRPYLCGPVSLVDFVKAVFEARELERFEFAPESFHGEYQIGDSLLVIEAGELPADIRPWTNTVYVYVPDVDETYRRAMERGAESIAEPVDKPYQERQAGFRDEAGNTWWVGSFKWEP
jgi:uncharacterized glyoxalase superfamily protein PhnB